MSSEMVLIVPQPILPESGPDETQFLTDMVHMWSLFWSCFNGDVGVPLVATCIQYFQKSTSTRASSNSSGKYQSYNMLTVNTESQTIALGLMLTFMSQFYPVFKMPGVNLPMSQIYYYLLTLLVCGVLHEVGHAIAAVR